MSDLISRQDAINGKISIQLSNGVEIYYDEAVLVDYLKNLPSADVVEVVRCKDCKFWNEEERLCNDLMGFGRSWYENDYCSYGERKEDDKDE